MNERTSPTKEDGPPSLGKKVMQQEPKRPIAVTCSPRSYLGERRDSWQPEAGWPIAVTLSPPTRIESAPVAPQGGFVKK